MKTWNDNLQSPRRGTAGSECNFTFRALWTLRLVMGVARTWQSV